MLVECTAAPAGRAIVEQKREQADGGFVTTLNTPLRGFYVVPRRSSALAVPHVLADIQYAVGPGIEFVDVQVPENHREAWAVEPGFYRLRLSRESTACLACIDPESRNCPELELMHKSLLLSWHGDAGQCVSVNAIESPVAVALEMNSPVVTEFHGFWRIVSSNFRVIRTSDEEVLVRQLDFQHTTRLRRLFGELSPDFSCASFGRETLNRFEFLERIASPD